jgi:hypothetical protein
MRNLSVAAIFGCFLVAGYGGWAKCDAKEVNKPDSVRQYDPGAGTTARALTQQLSATSREVRENAATALEAMGSKAAKALAYYIGDNLSKAQRENTLSLMQGITKAVTVLGKIGKDIADDNEVREALLSAADLKEQFADKGKGKLNPEEINWAKLQIRLAAIDVLGEINKHRGSILGSSLFSVGDFVSPTGLVKKVSDPSNPVSLYLWGQFSLEDQKVLQNPASTPSQQQSTLVAALNKILKGPSIYDKERFVGVKLSEETEVLIRRPAREDLIRLNRLLIEQAYPLEIFELAEVIDASDKLAKIAGEWFEKLAKHREATPKGTPPVVPTDASMTAQQALDKQFYANFMVLHDSQAKVIKIAAQVNVEAPPSKTTEPTTTEPALSKLSDAKILESSIKKIEFGYLEATKISGAMKPADAAEDKSPWQLKTEAAYDLLSEAKQLNDQLHSLDTAISTLKENRDELSALISALGTTSETSDSDITAGAANALSRIFSKPPAETPAADAAKKETAKDDTAKKETPKK